MQTKNQFNEQPKISINHSFILDVMKQNDTLVIKRGVCPKNYF